MGKKMDVNDAGIWVTYARGMKGKALREFKTLCEEVQCLSPFIPRRAFTSSASVKLLSE